MKASKKSGPKKIGVFLRLTKQEKRRFKNAVKSQGMSYGAWVLMKLNQESELRDAVIDD